MRSSLACVSIGISPISSSSSVPCCATSKHPARRSLAPVKRPFSWPNSSLSISVSGSAAQLIATNGPCRRGLSACSVRATSSLPVPLSPVISTQALLGPGLLQERKNLLHPRRHAHHFAHRSLVDQVALQHALLGAQFGVRARAADQHLQRGGLNRLLQEPVGAQFVHRLHGGFDVAVGRQHDGRRHVAVFAQTLQKSEAVQARHVQIGQNHVGGKLVELLPALRCRRPPFRASCPRPRPSPPSRCAGSTRHPQSELLAVGSKQRFLPGSEPSYSSYRRAASRQARDSG